MRHIIPIGLTILLVGCGTTTNYYTQTVQSWKGSNLNQLAQRWGRPDNQVKSPAGQTIYVYKTEGYHNSNMPTPQTPGISYTADGKPVIVNQPNVNTSWSRGMDNTCTAFFVANKKGTIVDTKINGTTCFAGSGFAGRMSNPDSPVDLEKKG